jgi:hypothetical protein
MSDAYLLLTPILMLGVLALMRFVGCDLVFLAEPDPAVDAPQNVVARPGNQRVELSWDPVQDAEAYVVKRSDTSGGPYNTSFDVPVAGTTYTDSPLPNGVTVFYIVAGKQFNQEGTASDEVSATPALGLITFKTLGTIRNNFTGQVGMVIQVGPSPLPIVGLGRIFVAGNAGTHTLSVADAATGVTIPGTAVTLDLAASPAAVPNEFAYALLPSAVVLNPNTEYYVLTEETDGGDQWFDQDTTVSTTSPTVPTSVANVTNAVSALGASFVRSGGPGHTFGPVDILF